MPLREQVARGARQQGGHARRARPQRGGDRRLRRSAGPLRHGNRVAAARTGRQGARQQGGHARRARPQRGSDCRLRRSARPLRHGNRAAAARTGRQALFNKGVTLGALGRSEEAIAVYDDLLARFGTATECRSANRSPRRSSTRGSRSATLDRSEEAIAVYDDLVARFGTATELPLREQVAKALVNKGVTLGALDRNEEAIAVYDDLVARFGTATELPLREQVAIVSIRLDKPTIPKWFVSYAWGDDLTAEGRIREEIVDRLCDGAAARGYHILRDKDVLSLGDSISDFMRRIGSGDRVFMIISDKYLRSPHCMFELSEVWRTSRQEGKAFLERVRIYATPDVKIFRPVDWVDWAIFWKQEHDALEGRAFQHGLAVLGKSGARRLAQMRTFYNQIADILGTFADIVQPRTFDELGALWL